MSTRSVLSRCSRAIALGALASITALSTFVPTAGATLVQTTGLPGPSQVARGRCNFLRNNTTGSMQTVTAPPTVWARNTLAGYGNDVQRVRYAAAAIEVGTNRNLVTTGFTGTVWAWDNAPAQWTGSTVLTINDWTANFQVVYLIQWLDSAGRITGSALQYVDSYDFYNQNVGPYAPQASCMKSVRN